ncbi:hypothetical protein FB451DRAFT_1260061 [Mycena latifolia]|nr:hypothetical protein FB451DRAFT_1260061 [Mycena latifolia]
MFSCLAYSFAFSASVRGYSLSDILRKFGDGTGNGCSHWTVTLTNLRLKSSSVRLSCQFHPRPKIYRDCSRRKITCTILSISCQ